MKLKYFTHGEFDSPDVRRQWSEDERMNLLKHARCCS